jgi:peroxiredoxin
MTFQQQLELCTFKSYYANSVQTLDYSKLFANKRTLVFSVPAPLPSIKHFLNFEDCYQQLIDRGVSRIVCVSSDYILIGPWADKQSDRIRGLADNSRKFVIALAEHYQLDKPVDHLARFWQYTVLINNGEPEQLWQNPIKTDTAWKIIKHPKFRYHGIGPDKVIEYLDSNNKDK